MPLRLLADVVHVVRLPRLRVLDLPPLRQRPQRRLLPRPRPRQLRRLRARGREAALPGDGRGRVTGRHGAAHPARRAQLPDLAVVHRLKEKTSRS